MNNHLLLLLFFLTSCCLEICLFIFFVLKLYHSFLLNKRASGLIVEDHISIRLNTLLLVHTCNFKIDIRVTHVFTRLLVSICMFSILFLLGNLSGWSTKGYRACPTCNKDETSKKIRSKICYMNHRRYLESSHKWRRSKKFNGKIENRLKPKFSQDMMFYNNLICLVLICQENTQIVRNENVFLQSWIGWRKVFFLSYHTGKT